MNDDHESDLWDGNLLFGPKSSLLAAGERRSLFVVIDWPFAMLRGYALYDLTRLAPAMGLNTRSYRREVMRHCEILQTSPSGAIGYLLAGLGHLGLNLGYMDPTRYFKTCLDCYMGLRSALNQP